MRHRRVTGAVLVTALAAGLAFALPAGAAEIKIGFVNPAKVSNNAPQADAARRKLEKEFAPRDQEIVSMQEKLRSLEQRLQDNASMSESDRQSLQRQIVSLRRDIQRTQEAFREDFNMRRNEELGELQRRILQTVSDYAKRQDYDLVVSDGVIYASDAVDITDRIIERLRKEFERNQQGG
ncbi:Chaperone protein Skp [wastewater metagenome]|uniref:Chaperone protein Skp n=3 Tax=root TaxID=1 RepID=A0A5B8R9Q5_9ZZZZ|nr:MULTISPECIES: OmpH family outer membrane protein [Arhodomonas]MCS4505653.1 OmpH family outer membrane protein [Arhodomonas aquaeolei]QEA04638.1 chaperone protein Skp [uncultured organism]